MGTYKMPEINHKDQPSIPPIQAPVAAVPTQSKADLAASVAAAVVQAGVKPEDIEKEIEKVLARKLKERQEASKPRDPDWKTLTEQEAMNPAVYIPIIEHEIPEYMNIKLKDTEYEVVWANRDQRRLGALQAEGYELLKAEHIAGDFQTPLKFDSEGLYIYQDVVAMRAHKRILFSKRRRIADLSRQQLSKRAKIPQQRIEGTMELSSDFPELDAGMSLYETQA